MIEKTEDPQRGLPSEMLDERVRNQRDQRSAETDAEVSKAHRLAARFVEPAGEQHLVWAAGRRKRNPAR